LEHAGIYSVFDTTSSVDRLFPNQASHAGKGLGNLIALPLYKTAVEEGNSCFIDTEKGEMQPFENQWAFLSTIENVASLHLDRLYHDISGNANNTFSS
jgi:hypothetical protein